MGIGAGRPKGSPNKVNSAFREKLEELNFSIPAEAMKLYQSCEREDIKQKILDMMAKYSHPTFKPVDQNGDANDPGLALLAGVPSDVLVEAFRIIQARKALDAPDNGSESGGTTT